MRGEGHFGSNFCLYALEPSGLRATPSASPRVEHIAQLVTAS